MTFTSIADLYFVSVGLLGFNIITEVIMDTGLVYLPFIFVIVENMHRTFGSSKSLSDTVFALRTMETHCYAMLIVLVIAFLPIMPYTIEDTATYQKICSLTGDESSTVELDSGDISPDSTLLEVSGYDIKISPLINFIMNLGNGVSVEVVNRTPCGINITGLSQTLMSQQIDDGPLAIETKEFMYQCYQPARSLALRNQDTSIPWIADPNVSAQSWPGHNAFRNANYYGNISEGMYSKVAMSGWQASPNNSSYYAFGELTAEEQSTSGFPTCLEWWDGVGTGFSGVFAPTGVAVGLRQRLIDNLEQSEPTLWEQVTSFYSSLGAGPDRLLKEAYFTNYDIDKIQNLETKDYADETTGAGAVALSYATRFAGTYGSAKEIFERSAGASLIQVVSPLVKAALLFVLLLLLPFGLIVSRFSMKFSIEFSFFIFAVLMCPILWEYAMLAQQSMVQEIFSGDSNVSLEDGSSFLDSMEGAWSVVTNPNIALFSVYILDALFLGLPLMAIGVFTAAGMNIGNAMSSISGGAKEIAGNSGSTGKAGGKKASDKAQKAYNKGKEAYGKYKGMKGKK